MSDVIVMEGTAPLLVFGGPYSNLQATLAIEAEARRLAIPADRVICTGDVVAYCANPAETTARIRAWGVHVVAGNCEESLAANADDCGCNFDETSACNVLARSWFDYASRRMDPDSRRWMATLPPSLRIRYGGLDILVVHGGTREIARWIFASQTSLIAEELAAADADLVIAGHCGVAFARQIGGRTWFNPGVIGMPANDGDPRTLYGLLRIEGNDVVLETRRLAYDHGAAAAELHRAGYAEPYARALETGLWPSLDVLPEIERRQTGQPTPLVRARIPVRARPVVADGRAAMMGG